MEPRFLSGVLMDVWIQINNLMSISATEVAEESDNEDENILAFHMAAQIKERHHRIFKYIEKTVANHTDQPYGFQSHFRLQLVTYEELERTLGLQLTSGVAVRKQLLSVLWLLATPDSFRSVGERFDLAKSSLFVCFTNVVEKLNEIAKGVIKWPNEEEKLKADDAFASYGGLRGCIGAVDGTFVEIKAPKKHPHVYTCRKCFYSIQVQGIALPNLKLTDVFTGYPGSVGDKRIFTNSPIFKNIEANQRVYFTERQYIIGDKAYPILPWCIPPFIDRGNLGQREINFNTQHAKTRQVIERMFALLFGRLRRLKYLDMNRTDLIPPTILACCVLHNLCLINEDSETIESDRNYIGEAFLQSQRARMGPENEDVGAGRRDHLNDGHRARNLLMRTL